MNTNDVLLPLLLKEFDGEAALTRKMLQALPEGLWDYQPHPKSMTVLALTTHIAELAGWPAIILPTDGIDFATMDYTPKPVADAAVLLELFETSLRDGRAALEGATDADLQPSWTMRAGDTIYAVNTKYETIRVAFAQTIHHRAQLGVYLRLNNIPIPGTYGPSADEQAF